MPGISWGLRAAARKNLRDIGGVEYLLFIAKLTIDPNLSVLFVEQALDVRLTHADQGIGRAVTGAAAAEGHWLLVEQAYLLLVEQAVQDYFVVAAGRWPLPNFTVAAIG